MLPVFQKQLNVWFGTLCSSCMVFTVINILNQIMWQTLKAIYTPSADMVDGATTQLQYLGMDLALIGAIAAVSGWPRRSWDTAMRARLSQRPCRL